MNDFINHILDFIASIDPVWRILLAGVGMALETSVLVGIFIPGDTIVLASALGVRSIHEYLFLFMAVWVGSFLGESLGFWIGRWIGPVIKHSRLGRKIGLQRWDKASQMLERNARKTLIISRFTPFLHSLVPVVSGMTRLRYRRFIFWTMLSCTIWTAIYVTVGSLVGSKYKEISDQLHAGALIFVLALVIFFLIVWFVKKKLVSKVEKGLIEDQKTSGGSS